MNFRNVLKEDGYILLHTVLVDSEHPYHPAPRDYLRFWFDWFYDVQYYLQITLQDYKIVNGHVFFMYRNYYDEEPG